MKLCNIAGVSIRKLLIRKLLYTLKPPCNKCPYTLGYVKFVKSPCYECKQNNYNTYYRLIKGNYAYMEAENKDSHK